MSQSDDAARQKQIKRNIRLTAAALWLTVAAIFCYMIAKYYFLRK